LSKSCQKFLFDYRKGLEKLKTTNKSKRKRIKIRLGLTFFEKGTGVKKYKRKIRGLP
jgi:hypothetical protein